MPFTREFLKTQIPEITKEQMDAIMKEYGSEATRLNEQITAITTERDGLKTQLSQRDEDLGKLKKEAEGSEALKKQFEELQSKYKTDTEKLTADLAQQQSDFAVDKIFSGIKFTSELAKKAAISEFKAQGFKMKDGKFEGGDAFIAEMKKNNASAFVAEEPENKGNGTEGGAGGNPPPPMFASGTGGSNGSGKAPDNPFNFGFTPVRTAKK